MVKIMAEEVHLVTKTENKHLPRELRKDSRRHYLEHFGHEQRRVMLASSFRIGTPSVHLLLRRTENRTIVIDVEGGSLGSRHFPAMASSSKDAPFKETNAAEVILGLDPCAGRRWVSPVALRHVKRVWEAVTKAGGVFVVDFDVSVGGWAKFRTAYICPAPAEAMRRKTSRVNLQPFACCHEADEVVPPLLLDGGKLFKKKFEPTNTDISDPVIFKKDTLSFIYDIR